MIKKNLIIRRFVVPVLVAIVFSLAAGCSNTDVLPAGVGADVGADNPYRKISAKEAYTMMNDLSDYTLLDVRTEEEFREIRIAGAILIPDNEIRIRAAAELPDKSAVILIYCRSGRRSANAAYELIGMGYKNVYDFGGIIDWPYSTIR